MKAPAEGQSEPPRRAPAARPAAATEPGTTAARPLSRAGVQRMQAGAGNRAVAAALARRLPQPHSPAPQGSPASTPATEAVDVQRLATDGGPVHRPGPASDPKFAALKADVAAKRKAMAAHPPASSEASKAQGAAKPPQDDKEAQGKAANAEKMNAAKPGEFDKAAFVRAVNEAIAAQAPKNLDDADKFGDSGKADAVKGQVQGQVADGKEKSANAIETTTKAAPDTSAAKEKPVTPLVPDKPPATPGTPDAAKAVPDKVPAAAVDFSDGPKQVDQQMAEAQVTEEQLAKSNEPEFTGALKEKKAGEEHAATAPGQVRAGESQVLNAAKAQAGQQGAAAMTAMAGDRKQAGQAVGSGKEEAKSADEQKRTQVTAVLQKVFDATKKDVEDILSGLDKKVDEKFAAGEKAARDAFTAEHKRRMDDYKDKRYSGLLGKGRWLKDKFAGLPEEANQIFVTARKGYVDRMQQVISGVADVIGGELSRAKQRIATGRQQLQAEVAKLPKDLQAVGKKAAGEFAGRFDELTESVDAKGKQLVETLASKYNDALKEVDAEIEAEKEKNKGLIAKAVDAVGGVIRTILQLKDLLLGVLAKAAQAVMAILKDPIGFLGHLVSAVGAGLQAFLANIGAHLKKGLIGWLLGAMSGAGLQLPAKFDLRGILGMIASLLGLTWSAIRGRIVAKGIPEQAMGAVEAGVPLAAKLQSEGVAGVTEDIKEQVGDLKENLFGKISQYLIPTVLIAGITWIVSLLNPASAFIKACKMIIDIVTFIVERGAQIAEFVNAVLDAVIAIAGGGAGGVPKLIESALAKSIPVLIGALAAILGIGGIANKVKSFFQALSKPVKKAVDWVVGKVVAFGKKIWAKLKNKIKGKPGSDPAKHGDPEKMTPAEKEQVARAAAQDTYRNISAHQSLRAIPGILDAAMAKWRPKGVKEIALEPAGNTAFTVQVKVNPRVPSPAAAWVAPHASNVSHRLSHQQARKSENSTWATGSFVVDDTSGLLFGPSKSRPHIEARQEATAQAKSHAEETVIARFLRYWKDLVKAKKDDVAQSGAVAVNLELHVGRSCCVNCATYVAGFVRNLRSQGAAVNAKVKFASLYMGGQMAGSRANPTTVPQSTIDANRDLFEEFLGNGFMETGGAVTPTNDPGRYWGTAEETAGRDPKKEQWYTIDRGKQQGELGLAILRSAEIDVAVLDGSDLSDESLTQDQQDDMTNARRMLDKSIKRVNDWIKQQKKEA